MSYFKTNKERGRGGKGILNITYCWSFLKLVCLQAVLHLHSISNETMTWFIEISKTISWGNNIYKLKLLICPTIFKGPNRVVEICIMV